MSNCPRVDCCEPSNFTFKTNQYCNFGVSAGPDQTVEGGDPCEGSEWPTEEAGLPFSTPGTTVAPFDDLLDIINVWDTNYVGWDIDTDRAYALFTGVVAEDFTAEFDLFENGVDDAFSGGIFLIDDTQNAIYLIVAGSPTTDQTSSGLLRTCGGVFSETIDIQTELNEEENLFAVSGHVVITKVGTLVTITVNDVLLLTGNLPTNNISNLGLVGIGTDADLRFSNISVTAL